MKLKMPGDVSGGLLLFVIVIGITTVELFLMKKVAYQGKASNQKSKCSEANGHWISKEEVSEGGDCCSLPKKSLPAGVSRCDVEEHNICPEHCGVDPSSMLCLNNPYCTYSI